MSVQSNTYIMFGAIMSYDAVKAALGDGYYDLLEPYEDNAFKPAVNPKDDITALVDGMSGEYIAIGHVTHKTAYNNPYFDKPVNMSDLTSKGVTPAQFDAIITLLSKIKVDCVLGWHVLTYHR